MKAESVFAVFEPGGPVHACENLPIDALSLGEGVFETVLLLRGRPVFPERHAARLAASCRDLEVADPQEAAALFRRSVEFCAGFKADRGRMRTAVFAGARRGPVALAACRRAGEPPAEAALRIAAGRRHKGALTCRHKTASYLENLIACRAARAAGFYDALWLDDCGNVAETSTANIFFASGRCLSTPPEGAILPGVVRGWILEKAKDLGLGVSIGEIPAREMPGFEFAFVTNSIIGIVPVATAGEASFADPRGAQWFRTLTAAYAEAVEASAAGAF